MNKRGVEETTGTLCRKEGDEIQSSTGADHEALTQIKKPMKMELLTEGQRPTICILELCMRDSSRHEPHFGQAVQVGMSIASSQTLCRCLHGPKTYGHPGTKVGFSLPASHLPQGWSKPLAELLGGGGLSPRLG